MTSIVIRLSDDGKKIHCDICNQSGGINTGWILKESMAYHLRSETHARSLSAQQHKQAILTAAEQSMQEESALETTMDFIMLSAPIASTVTAATAPQIKPSIAEEQMWENYKNSKEMFDAGINHEAAAAEERKCLEEEATNFDLWRGADFLPEEDPNDGELLLDELEQDDILSELLRNAHQYTHLKDRFTSDMWALLTRIGCTQSSRLC